MNINRLALSYLAAVCLLSTGPSTAKESEETIINIPSGAFSDGNLEGWSERSFAGNTDYALVEDSGVSVLRGHTKEQASIFYREEKVDLSNTPMINWSWKVDRVFKNIDEQSKAGDDFPARLYVVAKIGMLPWDTLAINYVWASQSPVGDSWPNPFTAKAQMVVIQSGDTHVGNWTTHSRNVVEDFKRLFNKDIDKINGYAVMVDGDNSKKEATAWFGQIEFSGDSSIQ